MTITFYLVLIYLNIFGLRKNFKQKRLESKMNVFFGIYSALWLLFIGGAIFFYFLSTTVFIIFLLLSLWLIAEQITDHAILIKGKNKIILQKEFMEVDKEFLKEAEKLSKLNKKHHK